MGKKTSFVIDGARLTSARIEAGFSMDELATRLKFNKSNLSRWEREINRPNDSSMLQLAVALGRVDFIREVEGGKR